MRGKGVGGRGGLVGGGGGWGWVRKGEGVYICIGIGWMGEGLKEPN